MKNIIKTITAFALAILLFPSVSFSTGGIGENSKRSISVMPVDPAIAKLWKSNAPPQIHNGSSKGSTAYGDNLSINRFYSFDIDNPAGYTNIAGATYLAFCGDFSPGDTDQMWIIDNLDDSLKVVDIATGAATFVVDLPCPQDTGTWTSLSIHKTTGQFYAITTDEAQSLLYSFDPGTGILQEVMNLGLVAAISSSFDASGTLYVFDIETDNTYAVDVSAATITELGPAGFDGNYAQGMGYDPIGDEVYLAAFVDFVGPQLRKLNRSTGEATLIDVLPGETGAFGFPVEFFEPYASAGSDATINANQTWLLLDAAAANYSSLLWTSSGNGYFINPGDLHPVYFPDAGDILSGSVQLCLTAMPLDPAGDAAEDCMTLTINTVPSGLDFGDAPESGDFFFSYPTTLAWNGARHVINPGIFLGNHIDGELDGQPSPGANGDDTGLIYPSPYDDEDGVTLPASVPAGSVVTVNVVASVNGYLDAWMDFDLDNTWFAPDEHIFTTKPLVAGNNSLTFIVPATATPGQSYLRFRFRDDALPLSFDGFANNGEVEDYTIMITENTIEGWDFGDAPDNGGPYQYPTLLSNDGARHYFVPGVYLGSLIDIEPDGQPTTSADGDDNDVFYPSLGDDEDGVTLPTAVSPGSIATIQVQASVSGFLDAWMDFDLDGSWTAANEHIFVVKPLNPGVNTLTFTIPSTAVAGQSYLRFRFRTSTVLLSFNGVADNGEVEDYAMQITQTPAYGWDFGDAPDGMGTKLFPTFLNSNGARHTIVPGIYLGASVDAEPDGQPDLTSLGDDLDLLYPSGGDDENGVTFTSQLISGSAATLRVVASVDGYLDAWMDFNGDGQWTAAAEHIFTTVPLASGTNSLTFNIPTSAAPGTSYTRFRFRDYADPINYYGAADNGEVEDYLVMVTDGSQPPMDFGDAPESPELFFTFPTTLARNGAAHIIRPGIYLGNMVDAEPNGQPNANATGDDIDLLYPSMGDDEDGVTLPDTVSPGSTVTIQVMASVDGYLDAWMDFNLDNTWFTPIEHIFTMEALSAGNNTLTFNVPAVAVAGQSFLRFRFRDYAGPLSFDGIANNGEVEDYSIQIEQSQATEMDFGDAPDEAFPTLLASDGARHVNDRITFLGSLIDTEADGISSFDAKGDDLNNLDDEDGVIFLDPLMIGDSATLQITASGDGFLSAWMVWPQDGLLDDSHKNIAGNKVETWGDPHENLNGKHIKDWEGKQRIAVPSSAIPGKAFMRFRFSSKEELSYTGLAPNGEVEDYQVTLYPAWSVTPTFITHTIFVPAGIPPLQPGDMLGVFFINDAAQEQCAGTILYDGQVNQMFAFGDDEFTPDVKEGFATGELFNWKLFSAASGSVEDVEVDYDQAYPNHDGTFVPYGFSALTAINYSENPCGLPESWGFVITGKVHSINIPLAANPNIFGDALAMGDWIGTFYLNDDGDEACGGAVQWDGLSGVVVNAYGDDPFTPEKDGFAAGEQIRWRLYDCDAMEDFAAQATYNPAMPCEGNFDDLCLSELLSLQAAYFQDYSFTAGWNSISTYLVPTEPAVVIMFAPNEDKLIILKNLTSHYWPYANVNTIGNWDNESGYAIKVETGFNMQIAGTEFTSTELTLSAGWHYLPVLSICDIDANELLAPHMDKISIVTDLIGTKVWWPDMSVFTLEFLEPGKAYKIRLTEEITLNFPECALKSQAIPAKVQNSISSPWGDIHMTPTSHNISILAKAMTEMEAGDCIGAFDQAGKLCGFVEVQNTNQNQILVLFGDDPTTESKDGFDENEPIKIRLMKKATGEESILDVSFDFAMPNTEKVFNNNGLSAITVLTAPMAIGETQPGLKPYISIYPNPTQGTFTIQGIDEIINLRIFNAFGEEVYFNELNLPAKVDLSAKPKGIYFVKVETDKRVFFEKLVIN